MASSELIIDEEYIKELRKMIGYSSTHSNYGIEEKIKDYINKMNEIKNTGLVDGKTAEALDAFISCAQKLKDTSKELTFEIKDLIMYFLQEIEAEEENCMF